MLQVYHFLLIALLNVTAVGARAVRHSRCLWMGPDARRSQPQARGLHWDLCGWSWWQYLCHRAQRVL